MNLTETVGRIHPLHRLRRSALFRGITRRFDPMIRWRLPLLERPIYVRLISNASLIADPMHQEDSIRQAFLALLAALPDSEGGAFWDIGANIGIYSWSCAQARPDFRVVSFEPDAKNLECLRRTSAAWKLSRHDIVPCAVADTVGRTTFFTDEVSRATGSLESASSTFNATHYGAVPRGVEIETVTIDSLIAEGFAPPLIVKIDVEGAELRVLQGGRSLLRECRPILLLEIFGDRAPTFALLEGFGYICFDSDRKTWVTAETSNILAFGRDAGRPVIDALADLGYPVTGQSGPEWVRSRCGEV
jgi:FkbM family methyltransferase